MLDQAVLDRKLDGSHLLYRLTCEMLPKLPLGIAADLETLPVSGVGDFYLLSIAEHAGSSRGRFPATSRIGSGSV